MAMIIDPLGDRMKAYEASTEMKLDPELPIVARVDGRGFSKLTRTMRKPDERFTAAMMATAEVMVGKTHALLGYVQSDEITLILKPGEGRLFDGRLLKLTSVLSSMASVAFNDALRAQPDMAHYSENFSPLFDCRVFQTPNMGEAVNALYWRVSDCRRNAISMVGRYTFGHAVMNGLSSRDVLKRLEETEAGFNDLPSAFRQGAFFKKQTVNKVLKDEEWFRIKARHRPPYGEPVVRSIVARCGMPEKITYHDIEALLPTEYFGNDADVLGEN